MQIDSNVCIPCKSSKKVWCILNGSKLIRCSFSESLVKWIVSKYKPDYQVTKLPYKLGNIVSDTNDNCNSKCLYAIMSARKEIVLRVTPDIKLARLLTECDSRYIRELYLQIPQLD